MKYVTSSLICMLFYQILSAQQVQWTWLGGDTTANRFDVYGNRRIFDPANKPGSMTPLTTWMDKYGNFYMFGGMTVISYFGVDTVPVSTSALWKYSPQLNQWAMPTGNNSTVPGVSSGGQVTGTTGTPAPGNTPGYLISTGATWTDSSGNWWMFGGKSGYRDPGTSCSMWKYDIEIAQWTYLKNCADDSYPTYGTKGEASATASPGARSGMLSWMDSQGRFYIQGGYNSISRFFYGDVWMYDPASNLWTWQSGKKWNFNEPDPPVHGATGLFSPSYTPGAVSGSHLIDSVDSNGLISLLFMREVWQYSVITNQWAWISGDRSLPVTTAPTPPRHLGEKGVPSTQNNPGPRVNPVLWGNREFNWLYGGYVQTTSNQTYYLNDLWKYNRLTTEWTWIDGDSSFNRAANFGIRGSATPLSQPGGRSAATVWMDTKGNTWMFGGVRQKIPPTGAVPESRLNDLWKLQEVNNIILPLKVSAFTAVLQKGKVLLSWNSLHEQSTYEFFVQRSVDGVRFTSIGSLRAAGNSDKAISYNYTDSTPLAGENFYRLEEIDVDRSSRFSEVLKATVFNEKFDFKILSNPVTSQLIFSLESAEPALVKIEIKDVSGRLEMVTRVPVIRGSSKYTFPLEKLNRGVHFVSATTGTKIFTRRFVKM